MITVLATVITSCFKQSAEKDKNSIENSVVVQGDRSKCKANGPMPPNNGLIGVWNQLDWRQNDEMQFTSVLEFKPAPANITTITFTNYCTVKKAGRSAVASVTSQIFDQVTAFNVAQSLSKTTNEKIGDTDVTCEVAAEAGTYRYQFDELCLVIEGVYYLKKL